MSVATMFGRASAMAINASNGTANKVAMRGRSKCYHVEVSASSCGGPRDVINILWKATQITVNDKEPEDSALRRFRRVCNAAKIVYEVRRRRTFENPQDIKKRKMKERGLFKMLPDPQGWEEVNGTMESAPFADLFGSPEDIFAAESPLTNAAAPYNSAGRPTPYAVPR